MVINSLIPNYIKAGLIIIKIIKSVKGYNPVAHIHFFNVYYFICILFELLILTRDHRASEVSDLSLHTLNRYIREISTKSNFWLPNKHRNVNPSCAVRFWIIHIHIEKLFGCQSSLAHIALP